MANLVSVGQVGVDYQNSIEQLLVLLPQAVAVGQGTFVANANTKQAYKGEYLSFNLNLNLPPACTTGFLPAQQARIPTLVDYPDRARRRPVLPDPTGLAVQCPWRPQHSVRDRSGQTRADRQAVREQRAVRAAQRRLQLEGRPQRHAVGPGHPAAARRATARRASAADRGRRIRPISGTYVGPDGHVYTQADLARGATEEQTWQSMLAVVSARHRAERSGGGAATQTDRHVPERVHAADPRRGDPGRQQKQISATATVPAAASTSATAGHAVVLLFVNQAIIVGRDAPTSTASSVRVTLDKVDGRWLISRFDPV